MTGLDDSLLKLQECRMTLDIMHREAESIAYKPSNKNYIFKLEDKDVFGKQTSGIVFTAFSPLTPGVSIISYYVEEKDGNRILFKKMRNILQKDAEIKGTEIMEGIDSFTVEVKDNNKWIRTWDAELTNKIPEELRFTVTTLTRGRPLTLYETASPKISKTI